MRELPKMELASWFVVLVILASALTTLADEGCVVELDLDVLDSDSPSKNTRQKRPLGVTKGGLIMAE